MRDAGIRVRVTSASAATGVAAYDAVVFGTFGDRKPIIGGLMRREPKGIGALCSAIRPRDYRVFAGVIDREHWPFAARLLYHALGGRLGDRRDWRDIDWARTIAAALRAPTAR